jgi:hypothetical protein
VFEDDGIGLTEDEVHRRLRLILDTGAAETIVVPEVLDELGYSPRDGEEIRVMRSAVGREEAYLIRVAASRALVIARMIFASTSRTSRKGGASKD